MKIRTRSSPNRIFELLGALPVDVEQDVATFPERFLDRRLRASVAMVEDRRPFDELIRRDQPLELGVVDEMIVHAVLLRPGALAGSSH